MTIYLHQRRRRANLPARSTAEAAEDRGPRSDRMPAGALPGPPADLTPRADRPHESEP